MNDVKKNRNNAAEMGNGGRHNEGRFGGKSRLSDGRTN